MKCMGVCLPDCGTLNALDTLGKNFDSNVHLWKANIVKWYFLERYLFINLIDTVEVWRGF